MKIHIEVDTLVDTQETLVNLASFITGTPALNHPAAAEVVKQVATSDGPRLTPQTPIEGVLTNTPFDALKPSNFTTDSSIVIPQQSETAPAKRGRKPRSASVSVPDQTDLEEAIASFPAVTELTDTKVDSVSQPEPEPVTTTLEQEVAAIEETVSVHQQDEPSSIMNDEPIYPVLPDVDTMDHAACCEEIRSLVVRNTGDWLRNEVLPTNKVARITALTLEQARDVVFNGRIRAGLAPAV